MMARKLVPPYFIGSTDLITCYKMYGKYYVRAKSSLTAERVKNDPCFMRTMTQANILARASRVGAAAYKALPLFCKEFRYYRMLTGKANLMIKEGFNEDKILAMLINKYVMPIIQQAITEGRRGTKTKKGRVKRTQKPSFLRSYRRLRMVEWSMGNGKASLYPMEAVDTMLSSVLLTFQVPRPAVAINSSSQPVAHLKDALVE